MVAYRWPMLIFIKLEQAGVVRLLSIYSSLRPFLKSR